tara:strand:+ start:62 stop:292 length:231 start_codon:yes stop_codon:yes gene_type:complete
MNKLTIGLIVFLIIGGFIITSKNQYDLKEDNEDRKSFLKDFTGWVVNLGKNIKDLTGYAQKQDWLPQEKNETDTFK